MNLTQLHNEFVVPRTGSIIDVFKRKKMDQLKVEIQGTNEKNSPSKKDSGIVDVNFLTFFFISIYNFIMAPFRMLISALSSNVDQPNVNSQQQQPVITEQPRSENSNLRRRTARLHDLDRDDHGRNTYNGNSTAQL